ncbi:MAG: hypothetical protein WCT31_01155 [Candidatus Micrarchaeia archaeon]|jgi:hypothetical protein
MRLRTAVAITVAATAVAIFSTFKLDSCSRVGGHMAFFGSVSAEREAAISKSEVLASINAGVFESAEKKVFQFIRGSAAMEDKKEVVLEFCKKFGMSALDVFKSAFSKEFGGDFATPGWKDVPQQKLDIIKSFMCAFDYFGLDGFKAAVDATVARTNSVLPKAIIAQSNAGSFPFSCIILQGLSDAMVERHPEDKSAMLQYAEAKVRDSSVPFNLRVGLLLAVEAVDPMGLEHIRQDLEIDSKLQELATRMLFKKMSPKKK